MCSLIRQPLPPSYISYLQSEDSMHIVKLHLKYGERHWREIGWIEQVYALFSMSLADISILHIYYWVRSQHIDQVFLKSLRKDLWKNIDPLLQLLVGFCIWVLYLCIANHKRLAEDCTIHRYKIIWLCELIPGASNEPIHITVKKLYKEVFTQILNVKGS